MRDNWFDSLIVGGSIALAILAIQMLTDGAPGQARLLLLLLAGAALAGLQLVLALRRARRGSASYQPPQSDRPTPGARTDQRNPFIRELTRDWTGLDDRGLAPGPPRSVRREVRDGVETADEPLSAAPPPQDQDAQHLISSTPHRDDDAEQPAND
jgi:hypothetical protein